MGIEVQREEPVSGEWSARRWTGMVVLIFVVQLSFIFWLGERSPPIPRTPRAAPAFRLAGDGSEEWLALTDPTLFALPSEKSFSGRAWLLSYAPVYQGFQWDEEPRWLDLPTEQLGAAFSRLIPTDGLMQWVPSPLPVPRLASVPSTRQPISTPSRIEVYGELAKRRLLSVPTLPAWPGRPLGQNETDLLTNTVVQVVVNAEGRPVSATLLGSSGSKAADDFALRQAPGLRFQPVRRNGPPPAGGAESVLSGLTWGQLVFEWQTQPAQ